MTTDPMPAGAVPPFDTPELLASLLAQEERLGLDRLDHDDAGRLGAVITGLAVERGLPVVVRVELLTPGNEHGDVHTVFQRALAGTSPGNDWWIGRKSAVVRLFDLSSFAVGTRFRVDGGSFEADADLDAERYAAHGGGFPLRVGGALAGVALVSGLPQHEDHALVVEGLTAFLGR